MDKFIFSLIQWIIYNQKEKKIMFNKDLQMLKIIIYKTHVNI
jgi:hypothetical protein